MQKFFNLSSRQPWLLFAAEMLYMCLPIITQNIKEKHIQELKFNKILGFYCFIKNITWNWHWMLWLLVFLFLFFVFYFHRIYRSVWGPVEDKMVSNTGWWHLCYGASHKCQHRGKGKYNIIISLFHRYGCWATETWNICAKYKNLETGRVGIWNQCI